MHVLDALSAARPDVGGRLIPPVKRRGKAPAGALTRPVPRRPPPPASLPETPTHDAARQPAEGMKSLNSQIRRRHKVPPAAMVLARKSELDSVVGAAYIPALPKFSRL
jgi:hypothetical protein